MKREKWIERRREAGFFIKDLNGFCQCLIDSNFEISLIQKCCSEKFCEKSIYCVSERKAIKKRIESEDKSDFASRCFIRRKNEKESDMCA